MRRTGRLRIFRGRDSFVFAIFAVNVKYRKGNDTQLKPIRILTHEYCDVAMADNDIHTIGRHVVFLSKVTTDNDIE